MGFFLNGRPRLARVGTLKSIDIMKTPLLLPLALILGVLTAPLFGGSSKEEPKPEQTIEEHVEANTPTAIVVLVPDPEGEGYVFVIVRHEKPEAMDALKSHFLRDGFKEATDIDPEIEKTLKERVEATAPRSHNRDQASRPLIVQRE